MRTSTSILKFVVLFCLLSAFTCEENEPMTCERYVSELGIMKTEINNLAEASVCNENFECRSIALGSKPCGGTWSYIVYSTSINTLALQKLVEAHNKLEREFNAECQQYSDCMMVNPPQRLECENNKCIAVFAVY